MEMCFNQLKLNNMKKLLTITWILFVTSAWAQDSVKVTIDWQARDIEYSGKYICDMPQFETMFDTLKLKFRVQNPPTGTTTVTVIAYTVDWINLYSSLNSDVIAVQNNIASRLKTLLQAVNQPFINTFISSLDTQNQDGQQNGRTYGRFRLRKTNN